MFRWFKKHFIPHEGNGHRPHFLRSENIRVLVLIVFVVEFAVLLLPLVPALNLANNNFTAAVLPSVLDDLTNQNRQVQHLGVLSVSPILTKVAELKAQDMAKNGYFAHTSPDGKSPWYWFKQVGYNYEYAGENLAVDFSDSQDVAVAWMNSPTHRANIEKNAYTEIGTGIATGTYQGVSTIFVAQEYGRPASTRIVNTPTIVDTPTIVNTPTSEPIKVSTKITPIASSSIVLGVESVLVATQTPPIVAPIVDTGPSQPYVKTNIFEKYVTSPRHMANIILTVLGVLVALALLLKLSIRVDKRHPTLITNGLIVLALIFGVFAINNYIVKSKMIFTTSFASFQNEQFDQTK